MTIPRRRVDTHINLGHTLCAARQYAEAIVVLRQATEIRPTHTMAHWRLGAALFASGAPAEVADSSR